MRRDRVDSSRAEEAQAAALWSKFEELDAMLAEQERGDDDENGNQLCGAIN